MDNFIEFVLGNFTLTFLVIGLLCSLVALSRQQKPLNKQQIIEALFAYFLLFSIGISFFIQFHFPCIFCRHGSIFDWLGE